MNKQLLSTLFVLTFGGILTGCASIVSKSDYPVRLTSQPSDARVTVVDENGREFLDGRTPTTVTLPTKAGFFEGKDYKVTFTKDGYSTHTASIQRGVDGWYIGGNLLLGGVIGWLIVDPSTGAMWTLQEEVYATLIPEQTSRQQTSQVNVVALEQVPHELRSSMVSLD